MAAIALATGTASIDALAQTKQFLGQPIVDLIASLRKEGIRIVYSDSLLPPSLRVTLAPGDGPPFEALREVLAPYGLDLEIGPRDTWLVIKAAIAPSAPGESLPRPPPPGPPPLETVVVTASRYSIDRPSAISATAIGRHTLENTPSLGQDPLRVPEMLPGVSGNRLSSRTHVRGGDLDESLILLDGNRLYSPYHLKQFESLFSSINPRIVESMDVRTGGYEARFGDRLSGVVDMHSIEPTEARHYELALSLLDASVLSSGLFSNGRGAWLTSVRRGNLDVLAETAGSQVGTPQYLDLFNKLTYAVTPRTRLDTGVLRLDDKITLRDGNEATAVADYDDYYYWLTLSRSSESGLRSTYRLATAKLHRVRKGAIDDPDRLSGFLSESSRFDRLDLSGDYSYAFSDRLQVGFGFDAASHSLEHRSASGHSAVVPVRVGDLGMPNVAPALLEVNLDGDQRAFYASLRIKPSRRLVAEIGARWDAQSLTREHQSSPRLNLLFELNPKSSLRLAWGEYAQSQSLDELAVADGESALQAAQKSRQLVLGLEQRFGATGTLRIEAYSKRTLDPARRYENVFERVSLIPELLPDRFAIEASSTRARGIEISVEGRTDRLSWWTNLTRAESKDRLATGRFARSWDEPWSIKAGGEWARGAWTVTASAAVRSGWPITNLTLVGSEPSGGRFNASRLARFSSIDVRANRRLSMDRGTLDWFIEVSNLLDHDNQCCLDYEFTPGSGVEPAALTTSRDTLLGVTPNLGLRWTF